MHKQSIASEDFGIDFDNDRWWRAFPAIYDGGSIGIGSPPIKIETASNRIIFRSIKKKERPLSLQNKTAFASTG